MLAVLQKEEVLKYVSYLAIQRLKHKKYISSILFQGCNQLTDATKEAIATNCKYLRYLDLRSCTKMTSFVTEISEMPTIQTFHFSGVESGMQLLRIPPPPLLRQQHYQSI